MYLSFCSHIVLSVLFNKHREKPFLSGQTVKRRAVTYNRQVTDKPVTSKYRLMGATVRKAEHANENVGLLLAKLIQEEELHSRPLMWEQCYFECVIIYNVHYKRKSSDIEESNAPVCSVSLWSLVYRQTATHSWKPGFSEWEKRQRPEIKIILTELEF